MRTAGVFGCFLSLVVVAACGGSQQHAELTPTSTDDTAAEHDKPAPDDTKPADDVKATDESKPADGAAADTPKKAVANVPTPEFKENGSVLEAINAVPQGTPRLNIEQDALAQPLNKPELYEPCKPGNGHFKAKVAVWDGKAVGLDLTTTPKNPKFAACVAERIRSITWPDKVKSLNVVEYTF